MDKRNVLERIHSVGVIPVVRAASADEAIAVAEVIGEGGIPILEITMTVPGALGVIEELSKRYGDEVLVGAGTVLDPESAHACRSEEHTSELQSRPHLVCRLLLEKKKSCW